MFKSPLVLPVTLIFAGALAFMATTGILPPDVMRLWPIIFVILGLVGLVSLSSEELGYTEVPKTKKAAAKPAVKAKAAPAPAKKKKPAAKKRS